MRRPSSSRPRLVLVGFGLFLLLSAVALLPATAGLASAGQPNLAPPAAATSSTSILYAVADATVKSNAPNTNFGAEQFLQLAYSDIDAPIENAIVLRFDLTTLPAGAIVDSASLELFLTYSLGQVRQPLVVWYVTSAWGEYSVTWNNFPTVQPTFPLAWTMDNLAGEYKSVFLTGWAQYWQGHPGENYGVMVRRATSDFAFFQRDFESKNHNEWMPRLVVEYHMPAPTSTNTPTSTRTRQPTSTWTATNTPTQPPTPTGTVARPTNTHTPTSTATSPPTLTHTPTSPAGPLPDLIITDLWPDGGQVCLQIQNVGRGVAPAGHSATLWVDGEYRADIMVEPSLEPGARWDGCFPYARRCSAPEDLISARADQTDLVAEADEMNNGREEPWRCDTWPPAFLSGPTVFNIGAYSADVAWTTDEEAEGRVLFGPQAGRYPFERWSGLMATEQTVTLDDLQPASTYHLIVEALDPSGNIGRSRQVTFETLPPADAPPVHVTLIVPDRLRDDATVEASTSDDSQVERVEFYIDGVLAFTDYSPPYQMALLSRRYSNGRHTITARAVDLVRRYDEDTRPVDVINPVDASAPQVRIVAPADGATVGGVVTVTALLTDDIGIINARFYVDGVYTGFEGWPSASAPQHATFTIDWDTNKLQTNKTYRLGVEAYDTTFKVAVATVDVVVQKAPTPTPTTEPAYLVVKDHQVSRLQNAFTVQLTVKNTGGVAASNVRILDGLRGFQPISATTAAAIYSEWVPAGGYGYADIRANYNIPAGQERIYTYNAVPILIYPNPPTPQIGFFVDLNWDSSTHTDYHSFVQLPVAKTTANETIAAAHQAAVATANYLLVTDPNRLFANYCVGCVQGGLCKSKRETTAVISNMAELARHRRGVLGYITTGNGAKLHELILPAGAWGSQMHGDFRTVGKGYLLIVGETNIVSSYFWTNWAFNWSDGTTTNRIDDTDQPIADTGGDYRPELALGRIIGDTAPQLAATLRRSIQVATGAAGHVYDHSHALSVSGEGNGQSTMVSAVVNTAGALTAKGYSSAILHWKDIAATQQVTAFVNLAPNRDILFIYAHGNAGGPGALDVSNMDPINFGTTHPFLLSASCLTGDYTNGDFVEKFFDQGGGSCIASTQLSPMSINTLCGVDLYGGAITSDAAGKLLLDLKRSYWDKGKAYRFWSAEYNFYGDPKYGASLGTLEQEAEAEAAPIAPPPASLPLALPPFVVTSAEDLDLVQIPGGALWIEPGDYMLPYYIASIPIPAGTQVQGVVLAEKSELATAGGLRLPVAVADQTSIAGPRLGIAAAGNLPFAGKDFNWRVVDNPDGSSTLVISLYPFSYNPLTLGAAYFRFFRFDIAYADAPIAITRLDIAGESHPLGEPVGVDLQIENRGAGRDIVVSAVVRRADSGEVVGGLLLNTLTQLAGLASFSPAWDSAGFPAGGYEVEVVLSDGAGTVLARRAVVFPLGVGAGEIEAFSVAPARFAVGQALQIALRFRNSGDLPATGVATVQVRDGDGNPLMQFSHDFGELPPGERLDLQDVWSSAGRPAGEYYFTASVLFNGASAGPVSRRASTYRYSLLPLLRRAGF